MPRRFSATELAACGTVTETELEPRSRGAFQFRRIEYVWRPSALLATQLSADFALTVHAHVDSDGKRWFRDAGSYRIYIWHGFLAGVALLDRLRRFTRDQRNEYRAPFYIYQYVQDTHAHLDCRFLTRSQLHIQRGARGETGDCDVLPLDLGLEATGQGSRWSIQELLQAGEQAAAAAGLCDPADDVIIAHGLYAAARRNPLRRTTPQLRRDIRRALFDTDAMIAASQRRLKPIVQDRFYRLLDAHLDDPQQDFNQWFFPAGGRNLPRAIGRQPNRRGGVLSNEEVTAVLLNLAWDAYGLLSNCLSAFGQAFLAGIPGPLSRKERDLFNLTMMPHRYFGGLPRWLLMERIEFLEPAFVDLLSKPRDPVVHGAFHRLLVWYSEMVRKRREADRLNQERRRLRRQLNGQQELLERDLRQDGELESHYRRRRRNTDRRSED